jgi:hypothetical protein
LLDIEKDPREQGFGSQQFDLVIAANVLHATADLGRTLENVKQLLAPEGLLVLLEATKRQRWLDLVFGLMEGWWRFEDTQRRPDYPLLSDGQWGALLEECGFREATAISGDGQSVIVARNTATAQDRTDEGARVFFADGDGISETLRGRGGGILVRAGASYERLGTEEFQIRATEAADYVRLFEEIGDRCNGVLHLWSIAGEEGDPGAGEAIAAQERGSRSVLYLVQALARLKTPPHLWLVTNGAIAHAPVWGMGKVIALEHPELRCVRVEIEGAANAHSLRESVTLRVWLAARRRSTHVAP